MRDEDYMAEVALDLDSTILCAIPTIGIYMVWTALMACVAHTLSIMPPDDRPEAVESLNTICKAIGDSVYEDRADFCADMIEKLPD